MWPKTPNLWPPSKMQRVLKMGLWRKLRLGTRSSPPRGQPKSHRRGEGGGLEVVVQRGAEGRQGQYTDWKQIAADYWALSVEERNKLAAEAKEFARRANDAENPDGAGQGVFGLKRSEARRQAGVAAKQQLANVALDALPEAQRRDAIVRAFVPDGLGRPTQWRETRLAANRAERHDYGRRGREDKQIEHEIKAWQQSVQPRIAEFQEAFPSLQALLAETTALPGPRGDVLMRQHRPRKGGMMRRCWQEFRQMAKYSTKRTSDQRWLQIGLRSTRLCRASSVWTHRSKTNVRHVRFLACVCAVDEASLCID